LKMPNHASPSNGVRISRNYPCPEFALRSDENLRRYSMSLLSSINSSLDFAYISRLDISVILDCSGLPVHHHAVLFFGADLHDLLKLIPALKRANEHRRVRRNTPPHDDQTATSSSTPTSFAPSSRCTSPVAVENTVASAETLVLCQSDPQLPSADNGFVKAKRPARSQCTHQPVTTSLTNRFAALDDQDSVESDTKETDTDNSDAVSFTDEQLKALMHDFSDDFVQLKSFCQDRLDSLHSSGS
jgi:hypothetical protein